MAFAGVIFDLDGTLVDSRLDFTAMRRDTGCPEGTGLLEYVDRLPDASSRARVEEVLHRHELAGARDARWMPGAHSLLQVLRRRRLPTGVVTRNSRQAATLTLERLGAPPLDLVAREDAPPKPAPNGLLQLARRWGLPPDSLVYIGDFHFDLEAAARAGMASALYLQPRNRQFASSADHVFEHFDQLHGWLLDQ